jgi:hypothetical protein
VIYENLNPAGVTINRTELNRREFLRHTEDAGLLVSLFTNTGVVYGLAPSVQANVLTVTVGAAVALFSDQLRLIEVVAQQIVTVPDQNDTYNIYLRADASVLIDPVVIGAPPATVYQRRAALAYAPNGLAAGTGLIETPGIVVLQADQVPGAVYMQIGRVIRSGGTLQVDGNFYPVSAALRGGSTGSGTPVSIAETDLDTALRSKIATFLTADGTKALTGSQDVGGHSLLSVASITGVGSAPVDMNVTELGGKTLAEIQAMIGTGGSAPGQTFAPYTFQGVIPLSSSLPAPRAVTGSLPAGSIVAGKTYALAFDGEGSLTSRAGLVLTFNPNIRLGTEYSAAWLQITGSVIVGDIRGISGNLGSFFVSLLSVVSDTETKLTLQKVTPSGTAVNITVFDSETLTKLAADPLPAPLSLTVSSGQLVWGGRPTGVMVSATGDPSDPTVTVLSTWVQGTRISRADASGITLQTASLAVVGTGLLVQSDTAIPNVTVSA